MKHYKHTRIFSICALLIFVFAFHFCAEAADMNYAANKVFLPDTDCWTDETYPLSELTEADGEYDFSHWNGSIILDLEEVIDIDRIVLTPRFGYGSQSNNIEILLSEDNEVWESVGNTGNTRVDSYDDPASHADHKFYFYQTKNARYLKLSSGYAALREVEIYKKNVVSIPADGNIALGKPVYSNDMVHNEEVYSRLVDGKTTDALEDSAIVQAQNGYFIVDFLKAYPIDAIKLITRNSADENERNNIDIELSNDADFSEVYMVKSYTTGENAPKVGANFINVEDKTNLYRFVRIQSNENAQPYKYFVELAVYTLQTEYNPNGNLAYGKYVIGSKGLNGNGSNLVDGDPLYTFWDWSGWCSDTRTQEYDAGWQIINLGAKYDLDKIVVKFRVDNEDAFKDERDCFSVQVANDISFADAQTLYIVGQEDVRANEDVVIDLSDREDFNYQYIRILKNDSSYILMTEVAAYAKGDTMTPKISKVTIDDNGCLTAFSIVARMDTPEGISVVFATYNGEQLVNVNVVDVPLNRNSEEQEFVLEETEQFYCTGDTLKIFGWSRDWNALLPCVEQKIVSLD